jgi:hypothetical protein
MNPVAPVRKIFIANAWGQGAGVRALGYALGGDEGADDLDLVGASMAGVRQDGRGGAEKAEIWKGRRGGRAERKTRKFGNAETKELFDRFKIVGRNKRTLSAFGSRFRLWFAF